VLAPVVAVLVMLLFGPPSRCENGKIIYPTSVVTNKPRSIANQSMTPASTIIMCGDVWCEGRVKDKKLFPISGRNNAVEFIDNHGKSRGPCLKEATEFFSTKDAVIGYCKKHAPDCSCQWPYDSEPCDRQEAYDLVVVQDVTCS
jgi:hypothetical protein